MIRAELLPSVCTRSPPPFGPAAKHA
jgi:hypothetical protein